MVRVDALTGKVDPSLRVVVGMATRYCLPAASEVAAATGRPVLVVANRHQVDSVGSGGYLGWTTAQWCSTTRDRRIVLGRDHGGPYRHPDDYASGGASVIEATMSAIESLRRDIESGVELLHIDGGVGPGGRIEQAAIARERTVGLVEHCVRVAARLRRRVGFEIGFTPSADHVANPVALLADLAPLLHDLREACGVTPMFTVVPTGTRVSGLGNSGVLAARPRSRTVRLRLGEVAALVHAAGSRLKAHGCDYLPVPAIRELHDAGAWMNVTLELGAAQTTAVLRAARAARLDAVVDAFCDDAVHAGYWRDWVSERGDATPDDEKVILGGWYLFATPAFDELRQRLDAALAPHGLSTARIAVDAAKAVIVRYHEAGAPAAAKR